MSAFSDRRQDLAAQLTLALADVDVVIHARKPTPLRAGHGWLATNVVDTDDVTGGEYRITYDVVISVGEDPLLAQDRVDDVAGPLIDAMALVGRGITVRPTNLYIDSTETYCVVATLITEVEAD